MQRNRSDGTVAAVQTQQACQAVFQDRTNFRPMFLTQKTDVLNKVFYEEGFEANITKFFRESTARLIKTSSLRYAGTKRSLDVVRDITNVTPILWLAQRFAIPLKTVASPKGLVTLPQLFDMFIVLFIYQNFNVIPVRMPFRESITTDN